MNAEPSTFRLLLVEDDQTLGYLITEYLRMKGFGVEWVNNGEAALKLCERENFDMAILDVMMPGMDGFTLAGRLSVDRPELPFIFLTAKSLKVDVLKGFALGAIDYLKKPIDEEELVIRIQAILARVKGTPHLKKKETVVALGKFRFDRHNLELVGPEVGFRLTGTESDLLSLLAEHRNRLCPHRDILLRIWGKNDYFNKKSLNVFITRLRKYLEADEQVRIVNVHGKGFILYAPDQIA